MKHPKNGCIEGECDWCENNALIIEESFNHLKDYKNYIESIRGELQFKSYYSLVSLLEKISTQQQGGGEE